MGGLAGKRASNGGHTKTDSHVHNVFMVTVIATCIMVLSLNFSTLRNLDNQEKEKQVLRTNRGSPYGFFIPEGKAVALPSIRVSEQEDASINRKFYGGAGDKKHLGGFTEFDPMGVRYVTYNKILFCSSTLPILLFSAHQCGSTW